MAGSQLASPACIRREIDAWPPSGLASDDQIDNLARSIWLALIAEGTLQWRAASSERGLWIPVPGES